MHFGLQLAVLAAALVVFRYQPSWSYLPLIVPALLVAPAARRRRCRSSLAAINVYARDTQHLLELVLLAWFWMTPIVYPYAQVREKVGDWALLNPLTPIVITIQRAIWGNHVADDPDQERAQEAPGGPGPLAVVVPRATSAIVAVVSFALLLFACWIFGRLEDNFAENI